MDILNLHFASDNRVVRPNHDLQAQMAHRKERLSFLIKFINDNAVISKVSWLSTFTQQPVYEYTVRCPKAVGNSLQPMRRNCTLLINCGCATMNACRKLSPAQRISPLNPSIEQVMHLQFSRKRYTRI